MAKDCDTGMGRRRATFLASALLASAAAAPGFAQVPRDGCERPITAPEPGYRLDFTTLIDPAGETVAEAADAAELSGIVTAYGLVQEDGELYTRTIFEDSCGEPYQVGYRLEGNTLHFPSGGMHEVAEEDEAGAEALLREAYGLEGEREALQRTKF